ncbi:MAG: putative DNA binding domain-containing protein [Akkermansia sp.]|nr:putative DNA binding domain-containing protein [Akkermansia sp.]MBR3944610.1 putative DNA binding domain-containing protein [Akkermansia sp.]
MNSSPENKINQLHKLINEWEQETIEFKGTGPGGHNISDYISALANEAFLNNKSHGWYIIGVDNKTRKIVGTQYKNQQGQLSEVQTDIQRKTGYTSDVRIDEVIVDNKRILIFKITAAKAGCPIYSMGHAFGRNGDQIVALSKEKEDRIRFSAGHYDWSAQIANDATTSDIDTDALTKAKEIYITRKPHLRHEIQQWTCEEFLQRLQLIRGTQLTNAALILLGKADALYKTGAPGTEIRWILQTPRGEMLDYKHLHPPFLLAVEDAYHQIRNTTYRHMTPESIFPEELQRYDDFTLREAINNAVAHVDYMANECINVVEIENDKVIINNAGSFLPGTLETVLTTTTPYSKYRNDCLANAMIELKLIDKVGSGIRTMFRHQIERLFPVPEYNLTNNHVQVTIQGKVLNYTFAFNLLHRDIPAVDIALLYDVYVGRRIEKEGAARLRAKKLITGKFPKIVVAAFLGESATDPEIKHTILQQQEMSTETYIAHIKDILRDGHPRSRSEILHALTPYLPENYNRVEMQTKLSNILHKMHKNKIITSDGLRKAAKWSIK